jgi:hypothetical protein
MASLYLDFSHSILTGPAREARHNFDISPVQATAPADLSLDIFSLLG